AQGSPMRPAWSADGQRLVFTIRSDATAQLPPVPPATTTLNVVDLESGEQRELARYADEHPLEPAYADADVVAGFRGFHDGEYEALDLRSGAALRSAPVSELFQGVVTSADGAVAGIVRPFEAEPTLLRVWRGADFATELARVEQDVPFEVLFWPGRTELVYARGEALWAMDYLNGERRMIRSGAGTPVAFTPDGRFLALRIESRAYLVLEREGDGLRPVGEVRADRLPRVERVIGLVTMP
ncbi:MAG: hypothetical protein ACRDF0_03935, partial [Candidatus Limnocylindria bacterium]